MASRSTSDGANVKNGAKKRAANGHSASKSKSGVRRASVRPMWQAAAAYAAWCHRHQLRKDGETPYVSHVFRVAMTIRDVFGCDDEAVLCAALLHDTIEDTGADYDDVASRFGPTVAGAVAAMTKDMRLPEAERERAYDAQLAAADWRARLIKLADCFDNLSDLYDRSPKGVAKVLAKCERALKLARADEAMREETRRATIALRALMAESRSAG